PSATASATPTSTANPTPTPTATATATATATPTFTPTASVTPTALATATPVVVVSATATATTTAPSTTLALIDQSQDNREPYRYRAEPQGYRLELFEKASGAANVRLTHLDSDTMLSFALPGTATAPTSVGATASAQVGSLSVRWTSSADRLKEELVLASRPAGDQVVFSLQQRGLRFEPDGQGGYLARDGQGLPIFQVLAPTAQDALGRPGLASLSLSGAALVLRLDPAFLAAATYPVIVDPTVVYVNSSSFATGFNNSARLLQDSFGKLLLVITRPSFLVLNWSNDGGATWSSTDGPATSVSGGATWTLDAAGALHAVYQAGAGLTYQRYSLTRATDGSHNILGLVASGPAVGLDTPAGAPRPSLVLDKNDQPAVAWLSTGTDRWEVRFLRAAGDPTLRTNWLNAQGTSTSPDVLGTQMVGNLSGSASLARMPAGAGANADGLYLFWVESQSSQLRWSKAQVQGANYTAWSAPVDSRPAKAATDGVATAADSRNQGIVIAYGSPDPDLFDGLYRKGADDGELTLVPATSNFGSRLSVGVDRGDLYVFYTKTTNELAYRRYLPERGLETTEHVLGSSAVWPTARRELDDGQADVAWVHLNPLAYWEVMHHRFATSRPFIRNLAAGPSPFVPLAGQSTTLSYSLADDVLFGKPLTVSVKVYDSVGGLVRTLVNGSQTVGSQSAAWDGKNDAGAIQPAGTYTARVNATDSEGLAAPEQTVSVTLTRQATTTYGYDQLSRLTSVTPPSGPTGYTYDSVGNRTTRTRGSSTNYSYDWADRITSAGGVSYTVNDNGNLVARGPDTFGYDQANRLKTATIGSTTSTYVYDGDGKRVSATVGTNPTVSYRYDVNQSLPVVLDDGTRKYVWGLGLAYAVDSAGNVEVYHEDGLGSVRAITDASAQVVQTYLSDEFGVPSLTQGTGSQPFQYTGEPRDAETGFVNLRARMYDPATGRFVQRDPFPGFDSDPLSLNRYSYVANDPMNATDPSGQNPLLAACAGGALSSVAVDLAMSWFGGEKVTGSQVLRSAATGCLSGLTGFGLGKAVAALAPRLVGTLSAADNLGGTLASCVINSFSADTPVQTADGPRPIASLKVGDLVLAYDEATGSLGLYPITELISYEDEQVVKLAIDGEVLATTPEHPFFTLEHGWLPAQALTAGLHVRKSDGGFGIVHALALEHQPQRMYNLTVEGAHTFFVGDGQWLVHNGCKTPAAKAWDVARARYWRETAQRPYMDLKYGAPNVVRMRRGLAPQMPNPRTGQAESLELHHLIPRRLGGSNDRRNLIELFADEHERLDLYRRLGGRP
ncbi:MAG: hypothetical protein HY690_13075, partial [Chloroflexi bacterium]|nr:hypothetical protein [Chloroflexota bacterium]